MPKASGRRATSIARVCAVSAFLLLQAGVAMAQAALLKSGEWRTADGGIVSVSDQGSYEVSFTDSETGAPIYSAGKVSDNRAEGDGRQVITLRPKVQAGREEGFVIELKADGSGDLYVLTSGGGRHKAATLSK